MTESFSASCRKIFDGVIKTPFYVYRRTLWGKQFWRVLIFYHFRNFEQKNTRFFSKLCPWICQICTLHLQRKFPRNNRFFSANYSFLYHCRIWKKAYLILSKLFWQKCQKCILRVDWIFLRIFFKNNSFGLPPSDNEQPFSAVCRKFLDVVIKAGVCMSKWNFLEKLVFYQNFIVSIIFIEHWTKIYRTLSNFHWQDCQNCILHVHRKILEK